MEIGILFGIAAMLGWGFADFMVVMAVKKSRFMQVLVWSQVIGAIACLVIAAIFFHIPVVSQKDMLLALAAGLLGGIASWAFYKGLQVGKVAVVAPIGACWVIITVFLSIVLLHETLTGLKIIAVPIVIIGAVLTTCQKPPMNTSVACRWFLSMLRIPRILRGLAL